MKKNYKIDITSVLLKSNRMTQVAIHIYLSKQCSSYKEKMGDIQACFTFTMNCHLMTALMIDYVAKNLYIEYLIAATLNSTHIPFLLTFSREILVF